MQRDTHDVMWGGFLTLVGLAVAIYAATHYELGTPRRMGPGFFPVGLGVVLAGIGIAIALPAWWRDGTRHVFAWRETLAISAALLIFGLLLDQVGIIITTALTVLVASIVEPHKGLVWRLVLTVVITVLTWAIFIVGLKMTIPVWPRGLVT